MSSFWRQVGILRSLLMYYGIPFRIRQLSSFYSLFVQPGDLCFDIGAHVGNHLLALSRLGAHVVGIEPQPHCMHLLKRWYGDHSQITLVEQAVGAVPGTQTLLVSQRTPTVTTLSRDWMQAVQQVDSFAHVRWDTTLPVSVTTLDSLITQYGKPAFCKIDVEGNELEVLRGLSQPIRALSFEYTPSAINIAIACIEQLNNLGPYEFNWKPSQFGESYRLQSEHWLNTDEMTTLLKSLPVNANSGDVYARSLLTVNTQ
ncbi:MAG: FkbM family methyltransferase [Stigonema ocellatum SAG 48.90 = DSM 106950]|nr:FkbM family methyltransferase [Stigonema ocellatum SAG 48.90 = DSM 106950]